MQFSTRIFWYNLKKITNKNKYVLSVVNHVHCKVQMYLLYEKQAKLIRYNP
jgi:hypothetical protein